MNRKPLPGTLDLVQRTWVLYTKKWNELMSLSAWFIYFGIVNFALALFVHFVPVGGSFVSLLLQIAMAILSVWVVIRLMRASLNAVDEKSEMVSKEDTHTAWTQYWPFLITGLLQLLIVFGGLLLLIVPGLYLGLALAYAPLNVIDQNTKGMKAVKASYGLVKGRWWSVWWRETASGFLIGLGVLIVIGFLQSAIAFIALGPAGLSASASNLNNSSMYQATMDLFTAIAEAATMPLFIILRTVIYRALQHTQGTEEKA